MGVFPKTLDQIVEPVGSFPKEIQLPRTAKNMYAVTFDLDTVALAQAYPNNSWNNAYADIRKFLENKGFKWQQGSTYFGDTTINAVTCVTAVQALSQQYPWFKASVRDIRMLRIEDLNDLGPAL